MASALFDAFFYYKGAYKLVKEEMYYKLFNKLTDILENIKKMEEEIKQIQIETEEMYISEEK